MHLQCVADVRAGALRIRERSVAHRLDGRLAQCRRQVLWREAVRLEESPHCHTRLECRGTADLIAAIFPARARVMFADTDSRNEQSAIVGRRLGQVVERELAMIAHHVVRRERNRGNDMKTSEREVARLRDIDVNAHHAREPRASVVGRRLTLQSGRASDSGTQLRQTLAQTGGLCLFAGLQPDRSTERTFENAHPECAGAHVIIESVQQDDILRKAPRRVIACHGCRERRQVRVGDYRVGDFIEGAGVSAAGEVVRPQHVITPRGEDGPGDLEGQVGGTQVSQRIAIGKRVTDGARNQRVDLVLALVVTGWERQLQR